MYITQEEGTENPVYKKRRYRASGEGLHGLYHVKHFRNLKSAKNFVKGLKVPEIWDIETNTEVK